MKLLIDYVVIKKVYKLKMYNIIATKIEESWVYLFFIIFFFLYKSLIILDIEIKKYNF